MTDIALRCDNVAKVYRIRTRERYRTLRDTIASAMSAPLRRLSAVFRSGTTEMSASHSPLWALKDIAFEIERGEVVGVIGRNGAGKSTLLKILSRITEPSSGRAVIHGRVGSLLEVGTGFHPELSGRENIYLNGAILGMRRKEIDQKFDEIVAFAEVEKFIDTPVKHYSTGMHVRLAFAVAAHLEPDILLVDEVLAVGDLEFQKKCLGKMGDAAKGGRTVLLVTHQMNQVRRLCRRAIWLDAGRIRQIGATADVVGAYEAAATSAGNGADERGGENRTTPAHFVEWALGEPGGDGAHVLETTGPVTVRFAVRVNRPIENGHHGVALFSHDNVLVWATAVNRLRLDIGLHHLVYRLDALPIRPGAYQWHVTMYEGTDLLDVWYCLPQMIVATEPVTHPRDSWQGVLNLPWDLKVM